MDGQWLTYRDLAVRLGVSVEAARRRALRGKWPRQPSNSGVTLVMPPDDLSDRRAPDVRADKAALVTALESYIKTLQGEVETLKQKLDAADTQLAVERAASEARAERQAGDFAAREAAFAVDLAAERARADKAIAAFASLAERLDALATERARPWWRRLVG
jgi:hypothetical protein